MIQVFKTVIEKRKEKERLKREEEQRSIDRRKARLVTKLHEQRQVMWSKKCPSKSENIFEPDKDVTCSEDCAHFHAGSVYEMPDLFGDEIVTGVHLNPPSCRLWKEKK
jgi:hypothetical protein